MNNCEEIIWKDCDIFDCDRRVSIVGWLHSHRGRGWEEIVLLGKGFSFFSALEGDRSTFRI